MRRTILPLNARCWLAARRPELLAAELPFLATICAATALLGFAAAWALPGEIADLLDIYDNQRDEIIAAGANRTAIAGTAITGAWWALRILRPDARAALLNQNWHRCALFAGMAGLWLLFLALHDLALFAAARGASSAAEYSLYRASFQSEFARPGDSYTSALILSGVAAAFLARGLAVIRMAAAPAFRKGTALLGGGLYSRTNIGVAGTFYFRYDGTGDELASFRAVDFDRELKARYLDKHDLKKNKELPCTAYERYQLRYIKARPGAGAILMFERKLITVTETRDANGLMNAIFQHHFCDVLIFSLNAEGEAEWRQVIEKENASLSRFKHYLSYEVAFCPEQMFIFFAYSTKKEIPWNTYCVTVDYEGNASGFKPVFDDFSARERFVPWSFWRVNDKEGLTLRYDKKAKTYSLVKILFDEVAATEALPQAD